MLLEADPTAFPLWCVLALSALHFPVALLLGCCRCDCNFNRCLRFERVEPPDPDAERGSFGIPYAGFSKKICNIEEIPVVAGTQWSVDMSSHAFFSTRPAANLVFEPVSQQSLDSFLSGQTEIVGTLQSSVEYNDIGAEWKVRVDEPTPFCGSQFHEALPFLLAMGVVSDAVEFESNPYCGCDMLEPSGQSASIDGYPDEPPLTVEWEPDDSGRYRVKEVTQSNGEPPQLCHIPHNTSVTINGGMTGQQPQARVKWQREEPQLQAYAPFVVQLNDPVHATFAVNVVPRGTEPETWKISSINCTNLLDYQNVQYAYGAQMVIEPKIIDGVPADVTVDEAAVCYLRTTLLPGDAADWKVVVESDTGSGAEIVLTGGPVTVTLPATGKQETVFKPITDQWPSVVSGGAGYGYGDKIKIDLASSVNGNATATLADGSSAFEGYVYETDDNGSIIQVRGSVYGNSYYYFDTGAIKDVVIKFGLKGISSNLQPIYGLFDGSYYGKQTCIVDVMNNGSMADVVPQEGSGCDGPVLTHKLLLHQSYTYGTVYGGTFISCVPNPFNAFVQGQPAQQIPPVVDPDAFFCGDALWVIENGPCREEFAAPGDPGGTVRITDSVGTAFYWNEEMRCPDDTWYHPDECRPAEVTVTLSEQVDYYQAVPFGNGIGVKIGNLPAADYVLAAGSHDVPVGFYPINAGACTAQDWNNSFPVQELTEEWQVLAPGVVPEFPLVFQRLRNGWCEPWIEVITPGFYRHRVWSYTSNFLSPIDTFQHAGLVRYNVYEGYMAVHYDGQGNPVQGWTGSASVAYGESPAFVETTVSQQPETLPKEGGQSVTVTCCPETNYDTIDMEANPSQYARVSWSGGGMFYGSGPGANRPRGIVTQEGDPDGSDQK